MLDDSVLATVVVPAYNAAATIDETLASIRDQTHKQLEIIVVDDGSSDDTRASAQRHVDADCRVRLLTQRNGGVAAARNAGLAAATGPLVAPVDADDLWRPDKIERQLQLLAARGPGTALVYTWFANIDLQSRVQSIWRPVEEGNVLAVLCSRNIVGHGSSPLMWTKDVLKAGGYDTSLRARAAQGCEDWKLYLALAAMGEFAVVPSVLVGYRQSHQSMSSDVGQMLRSYNLIVADLNLDQLHLEKEVRRGKAELAHYYIKRAIKAGHRSAAARALWQTGAADPRLLARIVSDFGRLTWSFLGRKFRKPAPTASSRSHLADFLSLRDFTEDEPLIDALVSGAPPPRIEARPGRGTEPQVSFIVPAFNAAATLGRALESLQAQSQPSWEAVVVDDGSVDGTAALVQRAMARDGRIRLIRQPNAGVSAARNAGVAAARAPWLVCLDADDHVSSQYLEVMLATSARQPDAAVVCCGFQRVNAAGQILISGVPDFRGDPFACFAQRAMGTLHSFMVRRALVQEVGGFNSALATCEDWDLFQRVFRTGARLAQTPEIMASYQGRPGSLSRNGAQMVADARTVFLRGSGADPRVTHPDPRHANGAKPARSVEYTCLWLAFWCAATAIGSGGALPPVLDTLTDFSDTDELGVAIFEGLVIGSGLPPAALSAAWPGWAAQIERLVGRIDRLGTECRGRAIQECVADRLASAGPVVAPCTFGPVLVTRLTALMLGRGLKLPHNIDAVILQCGPRNRLLHLPVLGELTGACIRAAVSEAGFDKVATVALRLERRLLKKPPSRRSAPFVRIGRRGLGGAARLARAAATTMRGAQHNGLQATINEERRLVSAGAHPADTAQNTSPAPSHAGPREVARFDDRETYWEQLFETANPWSYDSAYEQLKYERTIGMIPPGMIGAALELACAEGRFTAQLASRVARLKAVDISQTALDRAKERCAGLSNVQFERADFFAEPIADQWDLIVCSEVLYFLNDEVALAELAKRLQDALNPGGFLLTAHANLLADDSGRTGFEWDHVFGSQTIAAVLDSTAGLQRVSGLRTSLYRIDLYRRLPLSGLAAADPSDSVCASPVDLPLGPPPTSRAQRAIVWGGALATRADCNRDETTSSIPVLMFHQIAPGPDAADDRFRITPERFEQQLRFLRRRGYRSVRLAEWSSIARHSGAFAGRPLMLTFDDATADFYDHAWPILDRNGFSAVVFVVTDKAGDVAEWAATKPPFAPLMGWEAIVELSREGVEFGSHMATHVRTTQMTSEAVLRSGARSRAVLERALGRPVEAVALPYGVSSDRVRRLLRACGYGSAFNASYGIAATDADMLDIPRIEMSGGDTLCTLARKLQLSSELYPQADDLAIYP